MKDRAYESLSCEDEVRCIIGQAVIELSDEQQPVTKSTLALTGSRARLSIAPIN